MYGSAGRGLGGGLTEAELRWLVAREWASSAQDILWRRTKLALPARLKPNSACKPGWPATSGQTRDGDMSASFWRSTRAPPPPARWCLMPNAAWPPPRSGFAQHYPQDGWVEHDAEDIWRDTLAVTQGALEKAGLSAADIAAIGITNQRETVVLWDRATGRPLHRAIVWQDRRTAAACAALRAQGHEPLVQARTGLLLDPYFSATKLAWLLDTIPGARTRAEQGELAFGTIDSFLLWRLTEGREHRPMSPTPAAPCCSTLPAALVPRSAGAVQHPAAILPQVCDSADDFGETHLLGAPIPIRGIAGDQQAALVGQGCLAPGEAKITYGTGGFMLMNTGTAITRSRSRLLTTMAYRVDGATHYAMEGSLFVAGAAIKWLRDGLGIIVEARQTQADGRPAARQRRRLYGARLCGPGRAALVHRGARYAHRPDL
jgi:glycerol kinase